jgi:hypothetical protein
MKESVSYQAILAEGKAEGAIEELRKVLLSQGAERFGAPAPAWAAAALAQLDDLEQLEAFAKKVPRRLLGGTAAPGTEARKAKPEEFQRSEWNRDASPRWRTVLIPPHIDPVVSSLFRRMRIP